MSMEKLKFHILGRRKNNQHKLSESFYMWDIASVGDTHTLETLKDSFRKLSKHRKLTQVIAQNSLKINKNTYWTSRNRKCLHFITNIA